jgi:glycosyltransferase involved in cell wall biosynthesis
MNTRDNYPKVSMIVSTYNRPGALNLCLKSIANQTVLPDEVIIGDDGSEAATKELIDMFKKNFPVPIIHVWQEDEGFRLAKCRNKAVAASHYEYIIEIDGDLILHPSFVSDHLRFCRKGYYLTGGRVRLSEELTNTCIRKGILLQIIFFTKGLHSLVNSIHNIPLANYFATRYKKNRLIGLGCNMSFWKEDYIRINGYDEFFVGWGGEDNDFASRLVNSGVKPLSLRFSAIVYHLWHAGLYMENKEKNIQYIDEKRREKTIRCQNGFDKYIEKRGTDTYPHP